MVKPTQKSLELAELVRRSELARSQITQVQQKLRQKLDVPLRIRDSLKSSPLKWLGGSLGVGFVSSLLFRSKRRLSKREQEPEKKHRGLFLGFLMMLFALIKPTLKVYATGLLKDYLQNQLRARSGASFENDKRAHIDRSF